MGDAGMMEAAAALLEQHRRWLDLRPIWRSRPSDLRSSQPVITRRLLASRLRGPAFMSPAAAADDRRGGPTSIRINSDDVFTSFTRPRSAGQVALQAQRHRRWGGCSDSVGFSCDAKNVALWRRSTANVFCHKDISTQPEPHQLIKWRSDRAIYGATMFLKHALMLICHWKNYFYWYTYTLHLCLIT